MDPLTVLCLYSQYSTNSDLILSKIKKNSLDFIKSIPIDTLYSRKIVKPKVTSVPAIVIQYPTSLEIYEGTDAFNWLDEVIENKNKEELKIQMQQEMLELQKKMEMEKSKLDEEKKNLETVVKQPKTPQIASMPPPSDPVKTEKYTPIDEIVDLQQVTDTSQKVSASTKKTQDLLARARELEKGREDLSPKKPPF